ncbi:nucleoside permease [Candidatus Sulfidibacterium hydrothermale]|uniref:nucleoside permease n=1 Tax=Candidatus Sulfidibacterium hydrothermale TaxID=2875962 RepID=UPI001F0A670C|nr:nucleoside permease [Candidatus Sulfidibacterium hydrothermale]UBM63298.1 nucleoside permease [Candidatus Sulfidibacterium hydrothermale]
MGIKFRLTVMNFLQFFVWGAWLLSFGKYLGATLHFSGEQIGAIFMTLGIASLFMPGLLGIVADRWIRPDRLYAIVHILGAGLLYLAAKESSFDGLYWVMLLYLMLYMPTIALDNTVSYCILEKRGYDIVKDFPPIRVWGTIGFIIAVWMIDLLGWGLSNMQLYFSAVFSLVLGLYSLTLPGCPIEKSTAKKSLTQALGLDAFVLFKNKKMAIFFIFSMLLGAALQITNMWGEAFLHDFGKIAAYKNAFAVVHNGILMSVSQMSETLFILTIPFFLKKFGIKKVMLMSMFAWVFRFGLFGIGTPEGIGLVWLILSMIIYGMAFDFFNISGSLFVEMEAEPKIRASAQGLFMIMTNGIGAMIGAYGSGVIIEMFTHNGIRDWQTIWFIFAAYALVIGVTFMILFKYKHDPEAMKTIQH